MVDDFEEDVHGKRAKIDLMTLGKPEDRCHGRRSARRGHRADGGAEEGLATVRWIVLFRHSPRPWGLVANREW